MTGPGGSGGFLHCRESTLMWLYVVYLRCRKNLVKAAEVEVQVQVQVTDHPPPLAWWRRGNKLLIDTLSRAQTGPD